MKRLALLSLLACPSAASAQGYGYLQLGWGWNGWSFDRARTAAQVQQRDPAEDVSAMFDGSLRDAQALSFRAGYNVLGHAHVGVYALATGWDIASSARGGGGYVGGEAGWHPLALVDRCVQGGLPYRTRYDLWVETGAGYALVGKARALDGAVMELGLGASGRPLFWLDLGLRITWHFPFFHRYILDYDHRDLPGMVLELPEGTGGRFSTLLFFAGVRFGGAEAR
jgi:hypothetical protein